MAVHERYPDYLSDQSQFFDELIVQEWDTYQSAEWDATRSFEVDLLSKQLRPSRVLDVGCGVGYHDAALAELPGVTQVVAIDYSINSIVKANEAYPHAKVDRFQADLTTYETDAPFDLVVSFQVFEHLDDTASYFDAVKRVGTPGGFSAIFTPNRLRMSNRLRIMRGRRPIVCDSQHFREYTLSELAVVGREAGLQYVGGFGYGLEPIRPVNRISHSDRLRLGNRFPSLASGICAIHQLPS